MKKLLAALSGLLLMTSTSVFAAAESTPVAATTGLKVGVVDVRQVLQKSPQMAEVNTRLEKQFKPQQVKITEAEKTLQATMDKMNREGAVMGESARAQLQQKIISDKANIQAMITTFQQGLGAAQNEAMQKLLSQVGEVVTQMGKDGKYDVIFQGENVPYVDKKWNMTEQVIQAMRNKKAP